MPASRRSDSNSFALFGLDAGFEVDQEQLKQRFHRMMTEVHPDRHSGGTAADRRNAVQWASRINQAYGELSQPLARAKLLCALAGEPIDPARHPVGPDFLSQILVWRERLEGILETIQAAGPAALPGESPGTLPGELPDALPGELPGALPGELPDALPGESPCALPGKPTGTSHSVSRGRFPRSIGASAPLNALYYEVLAAQNALIGAFAASEVGRGARKAHASPPGIAADLVVRWMLVERIVADCAQHRDTLAEATSLVPGAHPEDCLALHAG
ncbi:MAG: Fe-S protein assembly co-chaperone HscB [Betaproteobacteria bacterium]|nr:Fe-S protein assembly co-chaperone HscB [Betaproteobacteria bacterium]